MGFDLVKKKHMNAYFLTNKCMIGPVEFCICNVYYYYYFIFFAWIMEYMPLYFHEYLQKSI